MKKLLASAALISIIAGCGGGGADGMMTSQLLPTVYTPDGRILNSCSLDPRCSGTMGFSGSHSSYTVTRSPTGYSLNSSQGTATPIPANIVRLRFDDAAIALDLDGTAGQVYRLYQAAFNRKPDLAGLGYWIEVIDGGRPLLDVANGFYQSAEFKSVYGTNPTYTDLVTRYYRNALQREPDQGGFNYWVGLLNSGVLTPAQVLIQFSESPENKARVIGDIQNGITYIPLALQQSPDPGLFNAGVSLAPAAGATVSGTIRLEVRGNAIANAELLPANGYTPRFGVFNVSPDRRLAWLDLDTRSLPNGPIDLRISAFDVAAGQPNANEVVAMPARRWIVNNQTTSPGGPVPFTASATFAADNGAVISGVTRVEVRGSGMENVELLPASGYTPRLGVFSISPDKTYAWLDLDTRTLPNGPLDVRVSAFNVPSGQPNATELVAMSPRRWEIRNGSTPPPPPTGTFTAAVLSAPANGAVLTGVARLEVSGSGIGNVELLPANGYTPRLGVFNVSADRTFAWMDFDSRALPNGPLDVRISAFNMPAGQPNAAEIVAMQARRWELRN